MTVTASNKIKNIYMLSCCILKYKQTIYYFSILYYKLSFKRFLIDFFNTHILNIIFIRITPAATRRFINSDNNDKINYVNQTY